MFTETDRAAQAAWRTAAGWRSLDGDSVLVGMQAERVRILAALGEVAMPLGLRVYFRHVVGTVTPPDPEEGWGLLLARARKGTP